MDSFELTFEITFEPQDVDLLVESAILKLSGGPSARMCHFELKSIKTIGWNYDHVSISSLVTVINLQSLGPDVLQEPVNGVSEIARGEPAIPRFPEIG
jgi:hypothetical protein